ncbi:hypothetical protein Tco_0316139 [Tanacetum coccineum]
MKQPVTEEGSSAAHSKYYDTSNNECDATYYSSSSDTSEEHANETDDTDDSDKDLSDNLLIETHANELIDFIINPVYTDAQITSAVIYPEGNLKPTSYISGASEVPLGTHVDVQVRNILLQEMFQDESALHILSIPAKKLPYTATTSQPNSLQAKARKLMQKAKKNMRKINFKKAVAHKFSEYDQKLEALTNFNVSETFEKAVQARVLAEIKKLIHTHIPKALANYVKPHLNTFLLEVMKNNHISLFTKPSTNTDDL